MKIIESTRAVIITYSVLQLGRKDKLASTNTWAKSNKAKSSLQTRWLSRISKHQRGRAFPRVFTMQKHLVYLTHRHHISIRLSSRVPNGSIVISMPRLPRLRATVCLVVAFCPFSVCLSVCQHFLLFFLLSVWVTGFLNIVRTSFCLWLFICQCESAIFFLFG